MTQLRDSKQPWNLVQPSEIFNEILKSLLNIEISEIWNLENQPKCLYFLIYFRLRVHHVSYVYARTLEPSRTASTLALN